MFDFIKKNKWLIVTVLFVIVVLITVYSHIGNTGAGKSIKSFHHIETTAKKWLNGYLAIFFRFKQMGNINWFLIPFGIYFLFTIKNKERWQIALFCVYILSFFIFAKKGYLNQRYPMTLFPVTIALVLLFMWDHIKNLPKKKITFIFIFLYLCVTVNYIQYGKIIPTYVKGSIIEKYNLFPSQIIKVINGINLADDEKIFVWNHPMFFYYSDKYAISENTLPIKTKLSPNQVFRKLMGKNVKYIFTEKWMEDRYVKSNILKVIRYGSDVVFKDKDSILYKLTEYDEYNPKLRDFTDTTADYEKDAVIEEMHNTKSGMLYQSDDDFYFIHDKSNNSIRIGLEQVSLIKRITGSPELLFGFSQNNDLKLKIKSGQYVSLIISVRAPNKIYSRPYLFIRDKTSLAWDENITKVNIGKEEWQDYLVVRRIRHDFEEIQFGVAWKPEVDNQYFEIRHPRIYIR